MIWFDRRGELDDRFQDRPLHVVIVELSPEEKPTQGKTEVVIDFSLTFGDWLQKNGRELDGLRQEEQEESLLAKYAGKRTAGLVIDRIGTVR